ncbi:MAG: hypothetical protein AAF799_24990 [Myxococcota bacterium]
MKPQDDGPRTNGRVADTVEDWVDGLSDRTRGQVLAAGGAAGLAAVYLLWSYGIGFGTNGEIISKEQVGLGAFLAALMVYGTSLLVAPVMAEPDPSQPMAGALLEERRRALWIRRLVAGALGLVIGFLLFRG